MHGRVFSKLTYANVMATVAVFIALGGASYAAFHLPKDSVRSRNIVNGQVRRGDLAAAAADNGKLAPDAVTSDKVANGSLTGNDVMGDSLTGGNIDEATLGPVPNASQADIASAAGSANFATQAGNAQTLGGNAPSQFAAACQPGAVKGYGRIHGEAASFPTTFTSSSTYIDNAFSCTGSWVVDRQATGQYRILQNGGNTALEPKGVVATVDSASASASGEDDFVTATRINSSEWELIVRDADGGREDATLMFMAF